jgi:hypothetical protein
VASGGGKPSRAGNRWCGGNGKERTAGSWIKLKGIMTGTKKCVSRPTSSRVIRKIAEHNFPHFFVAEK